MKSIIVFATIIISCIITSCSNEKLEKGFQVSSVSENHETEDGIKKDSLVIPTKPGSIVLTGLQNIRLTTVFKVNTKKDKTTFIGSNAFHYTYEDEEYDPNNNWNNHIIPGFGALYGYNMVNISHNDITENKQKLFFDKSVLIRTLYFHVHEVDLTV